MLESAFNKPLTPGFLERPISRVYLEAEYRGAAMVIETELGAYMSKFAVESFSDALRRELRVWGIQVVLVDAGW